MVLGILAGVAAPRYQSALEATQLDAAARRVLGDLRRCRAQAIASSRAAVITFTTATAGYESAEIAKLDRPGEDLSIDLRDGGFNVTMTLSGFAGDTYASFDLYGAPQAAGAVTLSLAGRSATIDVDALGNVELRP